MPFKVELNQIEIDSSVTIKERLLIGMLGAYLNYMIFINPNGFLHQLISEKESSIFVMLPGIISGCLFSFGTLFLLFRSISNPKKEIIKWDGKKLIVHFGNNSFFKRGTNPDLDIFKKKYEFNLAEINTLKLVSFPGGNEVCIDKGNKRIRLGTALSEIEKEGFYQVIEKHVLTI